MKKTIIFSTIILLFGVLFYVNSHEAKRSSLCPFCNPIVLEKQTFYETDLARALYTHQPVMPGHCLIIPKRHVARFEGLTEEEITQIGQIIKKVNKAVEREFGTSSYMLLEKNGKESGQSVFHVHFHYIPKKSGDDSSLKFIFKFYLAHIIPVLSDEKMKEIVSKMKQRMKEV